MYSNALPYKLNEIDLQLIELAFREDLGSTSDTDITTSLLFSENNNKSRATIISKNRDPIVLCGLPIVKAILEKINPDCILQSAYSDGQLIKCGDTLCSIMGPALSLLMVERTILNFLQRLCAIATHTAKFVSAIYHTSTKILDTRKTTPGLRHLEKYAVRCGGGVNHRMGLYDVIMIKDTHIDMLNGITHALNALPNDILTKHVVIVEVRSLEELTKVLNHGLHKVSRVLLDNMTPTLLRQCVEKCRNVISTEASGNVNLDNVRAIAESGVDFISIGRITHSAGSVDLSMICEK